MWTITMPVISTAHISKETKDKLDYGNTDPSDAIAWVAHYDAGWFIRFWDEDEDEDEDDDDLPDDLKAIRDHLGHASFTDRWVRIDSEGDLIDGLPTYDW